MALGSFIPTIWSETLYEELQKNYVGVKLSSRDFEGEIKNHGDRVKITGLAPVTVFDYQKNTDMPLPEELDTNDTTLVIDQAKGFNFYLDDIDNIQSSPKLLRAAMKKAADCLSDEADRYIYSLNHTDSLILSENVKKDNILDMISEIRKLFMCHDVPNNTPLSLEVSPDVEQLLIMANVLTDTNNSGVLAKGYVGKVMGFDVYVTNNLRVNDSGSVRCVARTQRAITFAEQVCSIKTYEPERRNGTAVKGLHLYGGKIIYPKEIIFFDAMLGA